MTRGAAGAVPRRGGGPESASLRAAEEHCRMLQDALSGFRRNGGLELVTEWGRRLAAVLPAGGRLLAAGNGGSAAQAQHLTAELVGRYRHERPAYAAVALHADTSSVTAIGNDYGFEELYARQVAAHGRPGDVLVLLSTSGRSPNLLAAADTARAAELQVWAMTGPAPNPLADRAEASLFIDGATTASVQEAHLVALHLLCESFDAALGHGPPPEVTAARAAAVAPVTSPTAPIRTPPPGERAATAGDGPSGSARWDGRTPARPPGGIGTTATEAPVAPASPDGGLPADSPSQHRSWGTT